MHKRMLGRSLAKGTPAALAGGPLNQAANHSIPARRQLPVETELRMGKL
jgi:hypothetical protein